MMTKWVLVFARFWWRFLSSRRHPRGPRTILQPFLRQTLAAAREKDHLPAVAALVQIDGKLVAEGALGVRALGHPETVTIDDRWHIGSDTKAFTATLIARLVEQGVMRFDDTLAASFPAFAEAMDPAYRNVTMTSS